MAFMELPGGELINPDAVESLKHITPDIARLSYRSGRAEDVGGEKLAELRRCLTPKKTRIPK